MLVKISIIVPVYNAELFLERCLITLLSQTIQDIEIIVINDGSKDKTAILAENFKSKDSRVIVEHFKKNMGVSYARNVGIDRASGEFITFVDADDWVETDMYERLYQVAKKENANIAICGIKLVSARGGVERKFTNNIEIMDENDINKKLIPLMCTDSIIGNSPCNKIYSNELIRSLNGRFPIGLKRAEDLEFNRQVIPFAKRIVIIPETLYNYFLLNNSAMRSAIKNYHDIYLENRERTLIFMKKYDLMNGELLSDLNTTLLKNLLLEVDYNCSRSVYLSILDSYKSIREVSEIPEINEIINSHTNYTEFGFFDRIIIKCFKKKKFLFVLLYGLINARVLLRVKESSRQLIVIFRRQ